MKNVEEYFAIRYKQKADMFLTCPPIKGMLPVRYNWGEAYDCEFNEAKRFTSLREARDTLDLLPPVTGATAKYFFEVVHVVIQTNVEAV